MKFNVGDRVIVNDYFGASPGGASPGGASPGTVVELTEDYYPIKVDLDYGVKGYPCAEEELTPLEVSRASFYVVLGGSSFNRYDSREAAEQEARELAKKYVAEYYALEAVSVSRAPEVETLPLKDVAK